VTPAKVPQTPGSWCAFPYEADSRKLAGVDAGPSRKNLVRVVDANRITGQQAEALRIGTDDMTSKAETHAPTIPVALAQFDKLPDAAHVRLPVVAALKGISPATVWRWVKSSRLPAPSRLSPGVTAWRVGDLRRAEVA
jgi:predicted DNA-binding transcriptional regulator AlpA